MLTIGEFSSATRLTVKALRIYHDEGLLVPERIDPANGYRYYGDESFRRARAIFSLRELGFSIAETKAILASCADDDDMAAFFRKRLAEMDRELARARELRERVRYLAEGGDPPPLAGNAAIGERLVPDQWICSIRYRGRYDEIGPRFNLLFKRAGRFLSGKPFAIYYDAEYLEDADIEAAIPVRKEVSIGDIGCRPLEGGRFLATVHRGPYSRIGEAYKALFEELSRRGIEGSGPIRESYLKGPGMILPRDPERFVTEILLPL